MHGTYWYVLVQTSSTNTLHLNQALFSFRLRRASNTRLTCSFCAASFFREISLTVRPPRCGLQCPKKQVQQSMYQYVPLCTGYISVCTGMECTSSAASAVVHLVPGRFLLSAVHIDIHTTDTSTYQYKKVHTILIAVCTEMCRFCTSMCLL